MWMSILCKFSFASSLNYVKVLEANVFGGLMLNHKKGLNEYFE